MSLSIQVHRLETRARDVERELLTLRSQKQRWETDGEELIKLSQDVVDLESSKKKLEEELNFSVKGAAKLTHDVVSAARREAELSLGKRATAGPGFSRGYGITDIYHPVSSTGAYQKMSVVSMEDEEVSSATPPLRLRLPSVEVARSPSPLRVSALNGTNRAAAEQSRVDALFESQHETRFIDTRHKLNTSTKHRPYSHSPASNPLGSPVSYF